jgi:protein-disulfide isomerase
MEVWSAFQCPACGQLVETVEPRLVADFVQPGRVRLLYRDFAFIGQESIDAAVGARCAERQDRFWQYHDYLFANQSGENRGAFSGARLDAIAERVGLDLAAYEACTADPQVRQEVTADRTAGQQRGVSSTPSLYVADELIAGVPNYEQLTALLEAALAGAGPAR